MSHIVITFPIIALHGVKRFLVRSLTVWSLHALLACAWVLRLPLTVTMLVICPGCPPGPQNSSPSTCIVHYESMLMGEHELKRRGIFCKICFEVFKLLTKETAQTGWFTACFKKSLSMKENYLHVGLTQCPLKWDIKLCFVILFQTQHWGNLDDQDQHVFPSIIIHNGGWEHCEFSDVHSSSSTSSGDSWKLNLHLCSKRHTIDNRLRKQPITQPQAKHRPAVAVYVTTAILSLMASSQNTIWNNVAFTDISVMSVLRCALLAFFPAYYLPHCTRWALRDPTSRVHHVRLYSEEPLNANLCLQEITWSYYSSII